MARIQLIVDDEVMKALDQGVALLMLKTGERQTRTGFIIRAIKAEQERLAKDAQDSRQK